MGRSLESIELFMRANSLAQPWLHDPKVVPLPWDDAKVGATAKAEQLVFGVIWTDGEATPHPPITRALRETVAKLRAAGHEVIDWDASSHREAFELGVRHHLPSDSHGGWWLTWQ
jgi:amidase